MKLIREFTEDVQLEPVVEEHTGKKEWYFHGITLQAEVKNANKRFYPFNVLSEAVNNYVSNAIQKNTLNSAGELNHPKEDMHIINMENVSHKFVDIKRDGNNFITKAKILDEQPKGKIAKNLLEQGFKLGISSRGLGDIEEKNGYMEVNSLHLVTAGDLVSNPAAPDAFVDGVLESIEFELGQDGIKRKEILSEMDKYKKLVKEHKNDDIQKGIKDILSEYIKKITISK